MTTEEDGVTVGPSRNELGKDVLGTWPQRTLTDLASLSTESNERMSAVAPPDLQIAGLQSGHLGDPCPGVVEEQQQGVFRSPSKRLTVGNLKQSLHLLRLIQEIGSAAVFFVAMARICMHQARRAGSRPATKRAKDRIAVRRWLRV